MGLLTDGLSLAWEETSSNADKVKRLGIQQFINCFSKHKTTQSTERLWGDEVEYMLINFDNDKEKATLLLESDNVLMKLKEKRRNKSMVQSSTWETEYAAYMVEGTPKNPYGNRLEDLLLVEENMRFRRRELQNVLGTANIPLTLSTFPRTGCIDFTKPSFQPNAEASICASSFFPDEAITNHPRYRVITQNTFLRKGEKLSINVPLFKDKCTLQNYTKNLGDDEKYLDDIFMDAMGFGAGCCSLQVTMQALDLNEARFLYDQLVVLSPIMLALSAASPIHKGFLSNVDTRWSVISQACDDRTKAEKGLELLKKNNFVIPTSRFHSSEGYLHESNTQYNDETLVCHEDFRRMLQKAGVDEPLSRHVAHMFIRDPLLLYREKLQTENQDMGNDLYHFENIQSTNWQSVRLKVPIPEMGIGWRVEFRPMEVQFSDFENAAFAVFVVLTARVILEHKLNLAIPIFKVHENIATANQRNSAANSHFHFRTSHVLRKESGYQQTVKYSTNGDNCSLLTMNDIINGNAKTIGLVHLITEYIQNNTIDEIKRKEITKYVEFISGKASGKIKTTAKFIRDFVTNHNGYRMDSVVTDNMNYDLLKECYRISFLTGDELANVFTNLCH